MTKKQQFIGAARSFLGHTGVYFTVIVMFFNVMLKIMYPEGEKVFNTAMFGAILLFSAIFALCDFIMNVKFIESYAAKLAIHMVLTAVDFVLVLVLMSGAASSAKTAVVAAVLYIVAYIIVAAVKLIIRAVKNKKENENKGYENLFGRGE